MFFKNKNIFFLCVKGMSHIIEYDFNTNDGLVFDQGKWRIKHISTKLINNKFIINLRFIGFKTIDVIVSPYEKDFVKVTDTEFEIKIKDITFNIDTSLDLIIEIKNDYYMEISDLKCYHCQKNNKILYSYIDLHGKSFNICSKFCLQKIILIGPKHPRDDEEKIEGEPEFKKKKTIPSIDILLMGLDHGKREILLNNNLLKSLNEYSEIFNKEKVLVKQLDNKYITSDRKPFLIFWESKEIYDKKIDIKDINGRDSKSWHLPAETNAMSNFQFLESAYYTLLFPVTYDNNTNEPINTILSKDNTFAIEIQKRIYRSHGMTKVNTKTCGFSNPLGCEMGWDFISRLYKSIIVNKENNNKYLETIIPDSEQVNELTTDTINLMDKIIETQLSIKSLKDELDNQINLNIKKMGGDYNKWYNLAVPIKKSLDLRKIDNTPILFFLINKFGDLSLNYNDIKQFIIKTWTTIISHVNPKSINYNDLNNISIDINYDDKTKIEYINNTYFTSIIEKIKNEVSIDIPTALFKKTLIFLEDGILLSENNINNKKISPFLQFRDIIFFQNMTHICLSTNIKRAMVLYGNGHIQHIESILHKQQNIKYNIQSYNLPYVEDYTLFKDKLMITFNDNTKNFINEISNKLLLYFIYEKIDYWLWEKEQYNDKISDHNSENKKFIIDGEGGNIKIELDKKLPKFQIFSNLISYWHEKGDGVELPSKYYYTIGRFIYLIISPYIPYITFVLNNYTKQYNNYNNTLNTNVLDEFKEWLFEYGSITELDKYMFGEDIMLQRKIGFTPNFGSTSMIRNVFDFNIK